MASAYQADGSPRVVGDILSLPAADIDASDRLRPIDPEWAHALGQIMLAEQQLTPIQVCKTDKGWKLVAGGHRHAAALMFPELDPLLAIEVDAGALNQRIAEISENLWRKGLGPIDRAAFVAELHQTLRAKSRLPDDQSSQSIAANARWKKVLKKQASDASLIVRDAYGWTGEIAERLGLSLPTIERDLMLHRRLQPGNIAKLQEVNHPVLGNATQLRALARLDPDEQGRVTTTLVFRAKTVAEALALAAGKPKPAPEDKRLSAFLGAFARMSLNEKKGALHQLAGMLPAGFTLTTGEGA